MINANQARENVNKAKKKNEMYEVLECEIEKVIVDISEKGNTSAKIILNRSDELRPGFIDEMVSLGYECNTVIIGDLKTLIIRWG